jgi:hypothetical protein
MVRRRSWYVLLVLHCSEFDVRPAMYSTLCIVEADLSKLARSLLPKRRPGNGQYYYELNFDIVLSFGLTELTAQMCWIENVSC